jgi:uncharacterized protein YggE
VELLSENPGKRIYYLAAVAMVAIVLISAIAMVRPPPIVQTGQPGSGSNQKTIDVTGFGTVTAAPDQAILALAVNTQSATATQATSNNAATMSSVMNALIAVGVSKDAIQTESYSLTPVYQNNPDQTMPGKIIGYAVRNAIQVTFGSADFNSVGKALDAAITAGANEVEGITFTFSAATYATLQNQALQNAIQNANSEAKAMASTLGVTIVGPISVTPAYLYQPTFQKLTAGVQQPTTPIQPGTLQITATVQVTYQFT